MKNLKWMLLAFLILFSFSVKAEEFLYFPIKNKTILTCDFCGYSKNGKCHQAIDIDTTDTTTKILSAAEGEIIKVIAKWQGKEACPKKEGYGNHIIIKHPNGYFTLYAHLLYGSIKVKIGDKVKAGQEIAVGDNTGCSSGSHLHFEVRDPTGKKVNPYGDKEDIYQCLTGAIPQTCGPNSLWLTCPPKPYEPLTDKDKDGFAEPQDCNDNDATIYPNAPELCDNKDNDCNNQTDEDFPNKGKSCQVGVGECQNEGIGVCLPSEPTKLFCSVAPKQPTEELCDSKDNDCDGLTDEDFPQKGKPCTVGVGECQNTGLGVCSIAEPTKLLCSVAPKQPQTEVCDNKDNDCDGKTDEGDLCDDGISCTVDFCQYGKCVHFAQDGWCLDDNPCNGTEICDIQLGCLFGINLKDGTFCGDDNWCNGTELCQGGVCMPGQPIICGEGKSCCLKNGKCIGENQCCYSSECPVPKVCVGNWCDYCFYHSDCGGGFTVCCDGECKKGNCCEDADCKVFVVPCCVNNICLENAKDC